MTLKSTTNSGITRRHALATATALVAASPHASVREALVQAFHGAALRVYANADLIGIPFQLIVGPRGLKEGQVEIKRRKSGERETLPIGEAIARLTALIEPQRLDQI